MDKIMGFSIFPDIMFSITFVSVMLFHNNLYTSISPKILKKNKIAHIFSIIVTAMCLTVPPWKPGIVL